MRQTFLRISGISVLIVVLLLTVGAVLFDRLLPRFINLQELKANIETSIEQSTGIQAEIKTLAIRPTLFDGVQVVFENNVLTDPEDIRVVQAGEINVNVRYWPLLTEHKTSISRVAFRNIEAYIGERSFLFRLKRPSVPSKDVVIEDARIELNDYHILVDRYFDGMNRYMLRGDTLRVSHVKSDKPLELSGTGTVLFGLTHPNQTVGQFKLYGMAKQALLEKPKLDWQDFHRLHVRLNGVELATLSSILQGYRIPVEAQGRLGYVYVDLHGRSIPKTLIIKGVSPQKTHLRVGGYQLHFDPGQLMFQTDLLLDPQLRLGTLERLMVQLQSRKFRFVTQGTVYLRWPLAKSYFDLTVHSGRLPMSSLELLPKLSPELHRALKGLGGHFSTQMHITGSAHQPRVSGAMHLADASIRTPDSKRPVVERLNGRVEMLTYEQFSIPKLAGMLIGKPFVLSGKLDLKGPQNALRLDADSLDLKRLPEMVEAFLPATGAWNPPRLIGQAAMHLALKGDWRNPSLFGTMALKKAGFRDKSLHGVSGTLRFQEKTVSIPKLNVLVGRSPLTVSGEYRRDRQWVNLKAQSTQLNLASLEQVVTQLGTGLAHPISFLDRVDATGNIGFDLAISGPIRRLSVLGSGHLADVGVRDRQTKLAISHLTGDLRFQKAGIAIPGMTGQVQGMPFRLAGRVDDGFQKLALTLAAPNVSLKAAHALLQSVAPALASQLVLGGAADLQLHLSQTIRTPQVAGTVQLKDVQAEYLPKQLKAQHISGVLRLSPQVVELSRIEAVLQGIPLVMNGTLQPDLKQYHVGVMAQNVPIRQLQAVLLAFSPTLAPMLNAASVQAGAADVDLVLSPDYPHGVGGEVAFRDIVAQPPQLGLPLSISRFRYQLGTGELQFPSSGIRIGDFRFGLQGLLSAKDYQLRLMSPTLPLSLLRDKKVFFEKLLPMPLPTLYNTSGAIQVAAKLTPTVKEAVIHFLDASASAAELKYPLTHVNGAVQFIYDKGLQASTEDLSLHYGNSPIQLSFDINGLKDIYLETMGTLSPLLVNDWLLENGNSSIAYAAVPFNINVSGSLGSLADGGAGNNLHMFFNFNIASLFANPKLENPDKAGDTSLDQAMLSSVLHLVGDTLEVEQTRFRAGKDSSVLLEGLITELFHPENRHMELSLLTEPALDLAALAQQVNHQVTDSLAGQIVASLKLISQGDQLASEGTVRLNNVKSAALELEDLNGSIRFEGQQAFLDIAHLKIPGVDVGFTATIADLLRYPLPITDFSLKGEQFIVGLYAEWVNNVIVGKLRQGLWEQFFPSLGRVGSLPFDIQSGTLQLAEGIIDNLIVEDFSSTLRVYPNTYFEMDQARAKSAGGHVKGFFAMSPRDNNFMTVHLDIDKMKANAVSRILLNVSNQIFGDLSGMIDYTTEGRTNIEMLANTNGTAELRVTDGRLPSIAKMENLLVAANTISGGLANLNLNSVFRLAAPFHTDYFATLTGTFKMVEGMIYTDNMLSDGQNLDLAFNGSVRMVDGFADMLVRGQMDREIGGVLGPLGDLSLGRFFGILPPVRQIIGLIPGLGFVPGFGGARNDEGVVFEVNINGPAVDPGAIQKFRWVQ